MKNNAGDLLQKNREVEPQRPAANVLDVQLAHLPIGQPIAAGYLPQPGDPGLDAKPVELPVVVRLKLVRQRRPGSNQTHLAPEHIEQLRQLIQGGAAQEPTERSEEHTSELQSRLHLV